MMGPPKLCFSCGNTMKDEYYEKYATVHKKSHDIIMKVLDEMGLEKPCCRRMILGYDPNFYKIIELYDESTINDCPFIVKDE